MHFTSFTCTAVKSHSKLSRLIASSHSFCQASGQTIPIVDGKSARPFVCIWDTRDQQEIRRIYLDAEERDVFAVSFSPNGEHLATISADDYHTVSVWDWRSGERICDGRGANAGNGVVWDTFSADCSRFCSFGMRALKMWEKVVYDEDNPPNPELPLLRWNGNSCSFGKCPMDTLVSAVFLPPKRGAIPPPSSCFERRLACAVSAPAPSLLSSFLCKFLRVACHIAADSSA